MRIRRNTLAKVIITLGAIGAAATGPALAISTVVAPAGTAVAASASPGMSVYHG